MSADGTPERLCSEGGPIMVSLVLTIIAFAGAMGVPAFLTAIVESAVRPSSSRARGSRRMNWTARYRSVAIAMKRMSIGQSLMDGLSVGQAQRPKTIRNLNRQSSDERTRPQPSRYGSALHGTTGARGPRLQFGPFRFWVEPSIIAAPIIWRLRK